MALPQPIAATTRGSPIATPSYAKLNRIVPVSFAFALKSPPEPSGWYEPQPSLYLPEPYGLLASSCVAVAQLTFSAAVGAGTPPEKSRPVIPNPVLDASPPQQDGSYCHEPQFP